MTVMTVANESGNGTRKLERARHEMNENLLSLSLSLSFSPSEPVESARSGLLRYCHDAGHGSRWRGTRGSPTTRL